MQKITFLQYIVLD
ncbi:hypothetical protein TRUGW13939_06785 [Talaromyces rugulosus]|uniref:Uncharacterized protein n=1 Tax=Talaromyces rugulosus TaxID=121627 RepID=A0A7H8R0Z9_TALRU|nr:hypothetical protein TRUGW13939_06785 [Talaromyces rugulosus]